MLPIVILVIYSFNASRLVTVWGGWSLRWYGEFFNDRAMIEAALDEFPGRGDIGDARDAARHAGGGGAVARRALCAAARCFPACSMRRW
jgi:hypothetical protein